MHCKCVVLTSLHGFHRLLVKSFVQDQLALNLWIAHANNIVYTHTHISDV